MNGPSARGATSPAAEERPPLAVNARGRPWWWDLFPTDDAATVLLITLGAMGAGILLLATLGPLLPEPFAVQGGHVGAAVAIFGVLSVAGAATYVLLRSADERSLLRRANPIDSSSEPPRIEGARLIAERGLALDHVIHLSRPFSVSPALREAPHSPPRWAVRQRGQRIEIGERTERAREIVEAALGSDAWPQPPDLTRSHPDRWQGAVGPSAPLPWRRACRDLASAAPFFAFVLVILAPIAQEAAPHAVAVFITVVALGAAAGATVTIARIAAVSQSASPRLDGDTLHGADGETIDLCDPWTLVAVRALRPLRDGGNGKDDRNGELELRARQGSVSITFGTWTPGAGALVESVGGVEALPPVSRPAHWDSVLGTHGPRPETERLLARGWRGGPAGPRHRWTSLPVLIAIAASALLLLPFGGLVFLAGGVVVVILIAAVATASLFFRLALNLPRLEGDELVGPWGRRIDLMRPWTLRIARSDALGASELEAEQDGVRIAFDSTMWGAEALVRNARGDDAWPPFLRTGL